MQTSSLNTANLYEREGHPKDRSLSVGLVVNEQSLSLSASCGTAWLSFVSNFTCENTLPRKTDMCSELCLDEAVLRFYLHEWWTSCVFIRSLFLLNNTMPTEVASSLQTVMSVQRSSITLMHSGTSGVWKFDIKNWVNASTCGHVGYLTE